MLALLEICSEEVKEHLMMQLDEIDELHENFKAKVVFHTFNKAGQTRGGQKELYMPIGSSSRPWQ